MAKGYRLLARRARTPFGEVDVAALKGGVLVIVEVKQRPTAAAGLEAVGAHQQGRLERAALYLAALWRLSAAPIRLDVIVVAPGRLPHHARGAWVAGRG